MYKLSALTREIAGDNDRLQEGENFIGRSRSCTVRVSAPDTSGKHCKITISSGTVAVENLSQNGTLLDDEPLEFVTLMNVGQVLKMGSDTALRLDLVTAAFDVQAPEESDIASLPTARDPDMGGPPREISEVPPDIDSISPSEVVPASTLSAPDSSHLEQEPVEDIPAMRRDDVSLTGQAPDVAVGDEEPPTGDPSLEVEDAPGESGAPLLEDEEVTSISVDSPMPKAGYSSDPVIQEMDEEEEYGTQEYDEAATRALETRALRPEDLEALREAERAKPRKRFITMGGAIALLLVAVFLIWPKAPPPETEIGWPRDANNVPITASVDGIMGGLHEGGYSVGFPGTRGWTKEKSENGLVLATRVGRDLDVPLLLTLEERENLQYLRMPLTDVVEAWMEERRQTGLWTFDTPRGPLFLGRENGVPFYTVYYTMTDHGEWYGSARIFQIGARRVVLRSDIPYTERNRAAGMLDIAYIRTSQELERRRWAGAADRVELSASEMIRRVRPELDRVAPATWVGLENNLMRACRQALLADDRESLEEAERLLVRLREMQALWFNAQRIARFEALAQGDHARVRQIADMCKGVFSSTEDNRYMLVRRERW